MAEWLKRNKAVIAQCVVLLVGVTMMGGAVAGTTGVIFAFGGGLVFIAAMNHDG